MTPEELGVTRSTTMIKASEAYCNQVNYTMLQIYSYDEMTYISNTTGSSIPTTLDVWFAPKNFLLSVAYCFRNTAYQLGLFELNTNTSEPRTGTFVWADGTFPEWSNWSPDNPTIYDTLRCTIVRGKAALFQKINSFPV